MILVHAAYKFCPRCKLCLPRTRTFFYFNNDKVSWCRSCKREGAREYRQTMNAAQRARMREGSRRSRNKVRHENPQREHDWQAANWRRVKADPKRWVTCRQDRRIDYYLRVGHGCEAPHSGAVGAYRKTLGEGERLNPEPFRTWLTETFPGVDAVQLAYALRMDLKTLRNILEGVYATVSLPVVDGVVTRLGRPDLLNDLYPLT